MPENNDIVKINKCELLDIFNDEDIKSLDLLSMSDFLNVSMNKIETEISTDTSWNTYSDVEPYVGEIATALESEYDISEMGMLVADHSHFSQDIIDGLKSGIYHVGQSKEVNGNLRPAILDDDEHLVKFFTLKKAINPTKVLSDISALSMQSSLRKISKQIEEIGQNVQSDIDFNRRIGLSSQFIEARDRIVLAASASAEDAEEYFKEADKYLLEGLSNLYLDINGQVKSLAEQNNLLASVKTIDSLLQYINEDMQMMSKYVGMRAYLFNYRGMTDQAYRILDEYQYEIQNLSEKKIGEGKYTAFELIHEYYPYNEENKDFWIEQPKQILESIDTYKAMLRQDSEDVFYIDAEEETDE